MKKIIYLLIGGMFTGLYAKNIPDEDLKVHIDKNVRFGHIDAKIVYFGGYSTPECRLAISKDGSYFYFRKVNSNCVKLTNSKGVKIVCNTNKSVCKTRDELISILKNNTSPQDSSFPSWCNSANLNRTEHTICANTTLSMLDNKLAKVYGSTKAKDKDITQKNWLRKRNICGSNVSCIQSAYNSRIKELQDNLVFDYSPIYDSIKKHDINYLKYLLDTNTNIDINYADTKIVGDYSRGTPLYYAFKLDDINIAKLLINKYHANINKKFFIYYKNFNHKTQKEQYTVLIRGLYKNFDKSTILDMIQLGADVRETKYNSFFKRNQAPMYYLAQYKYIDANLVKLFVEHGAQVNYGDDAKLTPLGELMSNIDTKNMDIAQNQYEAAKALLDLGANPNIKPNTVGGYTPMIYAADTPLRFIKLLQQYGGNLDTIANNGNTMLHKVQYYDSAKYMLDNGLKKYINTTNNDNEYPIEHLFSITTTDTNIIKLFIDNGAKVDIIDNDGNTFLHKLNLWYSRDDLELKNIFELAKILLKHHIDINHKNKKGKTVLDEVIDFIDTKPERAKTIAFLINNGATYTELHLNAIDKYFKACNSGNLEKVSNIVESNSYKHMLSEIKGMCKTGDNQCISKTLTDEYGAKEYAVLKYNKQYDSAYIFINDDKPKIIKLYLTADKKISFGEK